MEKNVTHINDGIMICQYEFKKHHVWEKDYVWNPAACSCENGKYLESIMDDSSVMWDKVIRSCNEDAEAIL